MGSVSVRSLIASSLVLLGCATARPFNEVSFRGTGQETRDRWMRLLATRYECDTVLLKSTALPVESSPGGGEPATIDLGPGVRGNPIRTANPRERVGPSRYVPPLGSTACQLAYAYPTTIRVWNIEGGIREEWMQGVYVAYQLEGPNPPGLRLTVVQQR